MSENRLQQVEEHYKVIRKQQHSTSLHDKEDDTTKSRLLEYQASREEIKRKRLRL